MKKILLSLFDTLVADIFQFALRILLFFSFVISATHAADNNFTCESTATEATASAKGTTYRLLGVQVTIPDMPANWRLSKCDHMIVTYERMPILEGKLAAIGMSVGPFFNQSSSKDFLDSIDAVIGAFLLAGRKTGDIDVDVNLTPKSTRRCADIKGSTQLNERQLNIRGRACLSADDSSHIIWSLYTFTGKTLEAEDDAFAKKFIDLTAPKTPN